MTFPFLMNLCLCRTLLDPEVPTRCPSTCLPLAQEGPSPPLVVQSGYHHRREERL